MNENPTNETEQRAGWLASESLRSGIADANLSDWLLAVDDDLTLLASVAVQREAIQWDRNRNAR